MTWPLKQHGVAVELPQGLDVIDLAYLQLERPIIVARAEPDTTAHERAGVMRALRELSSYPAIMLPPGFELEVIAPAAPHPFELARWADDGGPV